MWAVEKAWGRRNLVPVSTQPLSTCNLGSCVTSWSLFCILRIVAIQRLRPWWGLIPGVQWVRLLFLFLEGQLWVKAFRTFHYTPSILWYSLPYTLKFKVEWWKRHQVCSSAICLTFFLFLDLSLQVCWFNCCHPTDFRYYVHFLSILFLAFLQIG